VGGQHQDPPAWPPGKANTYYIGGWVDLGAGLDPPRFYPRPVKPVASRYSDYDIPAANSNISTRPRRGPQKYFLRRHSYLVVPLSSRKKWPDDTDNSDRRILLEIWNISYPNARGTRFCLIFLGPHKSNRRPYGPSKEKHRAGGGDGELSLPQRGPRCFNGPLRQHMFYVYSLPAMCYNSVCAVPTLSVALNSLKEEAYFILDRLCHHKRSGKICGFHDGQYTKNTVCSDATPCSVAEYSYNIPQLIHGVYFTEHISKVSIHTGLRVLLKYKEENSASVLSNVTP
jgi:hypothetical protein